MVAARAGTSHSTISAHESAAKVPTTATLDRIVRAAGFAITTAFHAAAAERARFEDFGGDRVPFLDCRDLAVFKAFCNRTKDWVDLEEMAAAHALDVEAVLGVLAHYLGGDDPRLERLRQIAG